MQIPRARATVLLALVGLLGWLLVPATSATAASAGWADLTFEGSANGWTGTLRQRAAGFPAATITSDSAGGSAVGRQSGASTFLPASSDVGGRYGQSRGRPYLNLRPYTANGAGVPGASTTTYAFDAPTPSTGWTFVLGDVDADAVTVSAAGPGGTPVAVDDLGFRSTFNSCGTGGCAANEDVPRWDPTTGTLTGNVGAVDTNGAAAWFEPRVPLSTLTLVFTRRAGFPVYQTWFAALSRTLRGTVTAPGDAEEGLTVRLLAPDGRQVGETTTDADGRYRFGDLATYDGYRVTLERPDGLTSDLPLTRAVDLGDDDQVADFALRALVPVAVGGTVRDPDGTPLPGVEVRLSGPGPDRTAVTDADGAYVFDEVPVGDGYTLTATPPDGTTVSGPLAFAVPADTETPVVDQDFTVTADPRGSAGGTLTVEGGDGRPGVRVVVTGPGGTERVATTDARGRWSVDDLPPGSYTATVEPFAGAEVVGDASGRLTVPERGGPADDVDFVLRLPPAPATYAAEGLVTDEAGMAFPDVTVTVLDPDGEPFATSTTGEDGTWRVDGLLPDEGWSAVVDPPEGYAAEGSETLPFAVSDADVDGLGFVLLERVAGGGSTSGDGSSDGGGSDPALASTGGPDLALLLLGAALASAGLVLVRSGRAARRR
ncbi:carboxypeptidase regulatory-like domain-containing protein [Microlunatus spumicola]|uniref:carboxypeptidase regulatory-like domain-containing protein n=1 Tax=Microlunatus spumicola TaxID=81499 RepID=UPI00195C4007